MNGLRSYATCTFAGLALLLSPAAVCFAVPFAYGILGDLLATAWLAPVALSLAALIAANAARRATRAA